MPVWAGSRPYLVLRRSAARGGGVGAVARLDPYFGARYVSASRVLPLRACPLPAFCFRFPFTLQAVSRSASQQGRGKGNGPQGGTRLGEEDDAPARGWLINWSRRSPRWRGFPCTLVGCSRKTPSRNLTVFDPRLLHLSATCCVVPVLVSVTPCLASRSVDNSMKSPRSDAHFSKLLTGCCFVSFSPSSETFLFAGVPSSHVLHAGTE